MYGKDTLTEKLAVNQRDADRVQTAMGQLLTVYTKPVRDEKDEELGLKCLFDILSSHFSLQKSIADDLARLVQKGN